MPPKIKICGITNLEDALAALRLGVAMLGFNFFPESPRYISPEAAGRILARLPASAVSVGVLVKPKLQDVLQLLRSCPLRALQIYEPVDFSRCGRIPVPVISALRLEKGKPFRDPLPDAWMVLVDAFSPRAYGGTGKTLDWSALPAISRDRLIVAGGITPENVGRLLRQVQPAVLDVASGVESRPGKKDVSKMAALVTAVQQFYRIKTHEAKNDPNP